MRDHVKSGPSSYACSFSGDDAVFQVCRLDDTALRAFTFWNFWISQQGEEAQGKSADRTWQVSVIYNQCNSCVHADLVKQNVVHVQL
jgi:hypothetical protein